jgi:hypothetical protein
VLYLNGRNGALQCNKNWIRFVALDLAACEARADAWCFRHHLPLGVLPKARSAWAHQAL